MLAEEELIRTEASTALSRYSSRMRGMRRGLGGLVPKSKRGRRRDPLRASVDPQGHGPSTQRRKWDSDTERHECMYVLTKTNNKNTKTTNQKSVTTEQAGEQMSIPVRKRTEMKE